MSNINAFLVRGADGSCDLDATVLKFRGELEKYLAQRETEDAGIAAAVHEVFDTYKGANINMPALQGFVLQKMGATPANWAVLGERIADYVRSQAGEGGLYKIAKGKNGGVRRVADIKPEAPKS